MKQDNSLFCDEEDLIRGAENLLTQCPDVLPTGQFAALLDNYKKLYRQSVRLVKMGDRMQGQLNRLNDQLAKSEEKYRSIFESSIQGIYRSIPQGRFLDLNPAMAKMFGYDSATQMVQEVTDITEDIFLSREQRASFLESLQRKGVLRDYPLKLRRRDGERIWVEVCTRGLFDASGRLREMEGVVADVTEKRRMLKKLENLARRDGLTGLWNRRFFFELGQRELARALRDRSALSLIYFDADHFKNINDTHGHETGDLVLKELVTLGSRLLRELDIFGRMGGEEFAILLPETSSGGALHVAEKLRRAFEEHRVIAPQATVRFTASFGVAQYCPGCPCLEHLISLADKALYKAKAGGRNRVASAAPCENV